MTHCPICDTTVVSSDNDFCQKCNLDPQKVTLFLRVQEYEQAQAKPSPSPLQIFQATHCTNCESHCTEPSPCILALLLEALTKETAKNER